MRHVSSASITLLSEVSGRIALWGGTRVEGLSHKAAMRGNVIASLMQTRLCPPACISLEYGYGKGWMLLQFRGNSTLTDANSPSRMDGWICPGQERSTSNQRRTSKTPASVCVVFCLVASVGFSKVHFRLDVTRGAQFFFFFWKSRPISRPCCHFPQPRPSEPTTHRLKSHFNKPHNHKIIRSQLHY